MKIIQKAKFIVFTQLLLVTTSCINPVSSNWSCRNSFSGSCKTILEIDNSIADNKNYGNTNLDNMFKRKNNDNSVSPFDSANPFNSFRSRESVARVMFSPYIDEAGNRHDKSIVYYLEQKSEWKE